MDKTTFFSDKISVGAINLERDDQENTTVLGVGW